MFVSDIVFKESSDDDDDDDDRGNSDWLFELQDSDGETVDLVTVHRKMLWNRADVMILFFLRQAGAPLTLV